MHKHLPHYNKSLVPIARALRRNMTDAERKLWSVLRNNQADVKFRRQVPYNQYVLDFYCNALKLNIELDGSQHYSKGGIKKDKKRDDNLSKDGIEVMRFTSLDVLRNIEGVGATIAEKIQAKLRIKSEAPSPLRRRARACPPIFMAG